MRSVAAECTVVKRYTRVVVNHKRGPLWGDLTFGWPSPSSATPRGLRFAQRAGMRHSTASSPGSAPPRRPTARRPSAPSVAARRPTRSTSQHRSSAARSWAATTSIAATGP